MTAGWRTGAAGGSETGTWSLIRTKRSLLRSPLPFLQVPEERRRTEETKKNIGKIEFPLSLLSKLLHLQNGKKKEKKVLWLFRLNKFPSLKCWLCVIVMKGEHHKCLAVTHCAASIIYSSQFIGSQMQRAKNNQDVRFQPGQPAILRGSKFMSQSLMYVSVAAVWTNSRNTKCVKEGSIWLFFMLTALVSFIAIFSNLSDFKQSASRLRDQRRERLLYLFILFPSPFFIVLLNYNPPPLRWRWTAPRSDNRERSHRLEFFFVGMKWITPMTWHGSVSDDTCWYVRRRRMRKRVTGGHL